MARFFLVLFSLYLFLISESFINTGVKKVFKRFSIITLLILLGIYASINLYEYTHSNTMLPVTKPDNKSSINAALAPEKEIITLTAAGDCLMHNTQIWSGLQDDGTYAFPSFFAPVKDLISEGDYSSVNFETPMAGPDSGYTGYPLFNSPDAIADDIRAAGFDLVITANNHALDRGCQGAIRTLEVLHNAGLDTVGTYENETASHSFLIKDIRGVKVGYLAYSYGTNGLPVPSEHAYLFNFLDKKKILADMQELRPQVDILVLVLHWGVEYHPQPTKEQRAMSVEFLESGADVILGSHPHVIQPMEVIKINGKDKFVIYSMGNFISHQIGQERNSGIVLKIKFTKHFDSGETFLETVSYTPTFSHSYYENGKKQFRVVPVENTIEKIEAGTEPYMSKADLPVLKAVLKSTRSQLGETFQRPAE